MAINRDTMVASVGDGALRAEVVDEAGVLGTWVEYCGQERMEDDDERQGGVNKKYDHIAKTAPDPKPPLQRPLRWCVRRALALAPSHTVAACAPVA